MDVLLRLTVHVAVVLLYDGAILHVLIRMFRSLLYNIVMPSVFKVFAFFLRCEIAPLIVIE